MEIDKDEISKRTVWRKYLHYEKIGEGFMPKTNSAGVFCVREVSGYAIWYCRFLDGDAAPDITLDGKHLLRFFAPAAKHSAIEYAVLATRPELPLDEAIALLDADAKALMLENPAQLEPFFERVN